MKDCKMQILPVRSWMFRHLLPNLKIVKEDKVKEVLGKNELANRRKK
jgi:hypothetical protein